MGKRKPISSGTGCLILIILVGIFILISQWGSSPGRKTELSETPKDAKTKPAQINWRELANNMIKDYQGKIAEIRQLNSTTCWAVLSSNLSIVQAVEAAENIGEYIKNVEGEKPSIHVFLNNKHVAVARANLSGFYQGKIDIQNWMAWDEW